ncbi:MAG TPA: HipA domain-containing protein [Aquabacterium sp.]|nr:HipA domain-containing protein [Aquabacterium sp.]
MRHDDLSLWFLADPTAPRHVGQLRLVDAGKGVSLQYGDAWLRDGFPISEDLVLTDIEQLPRWRHMAAGAVDDARPDRWGERVIQYIDKPARLSIMEYLYYAGDDRFGALGVSTSADAYVPHPKGPLPRLEQAQALSEVVHKVSAKEPINDLERKMLAAGGSFGGAKPKALIEIAGEQWIIKFFNHEPIDVPLVEHASMTLAARASITVAETRVVPLLGEHALVVRRYDRDGGRRIHCISAGTALRAQTVVGQEPDLGYPALAQLLRRTGIAEDSRNLLDMQELFRRMVFNILIDNTDDHEKNHALMALAPTRQGRYRLAPAYDVLPTNSGQGFQEFVVGVDQRDSTLTNAMSQCELFGYTRPQAAAEVARVIAVVDGWKDHFAQCGVSGADIDSLAERMDGDELLKQRRSFDPGEHSVSSRPKRRRSPFER